MCREHFNINIVYSLFMCSPRTVYKNCPTRIKDNAFLSPSELSHNSYCRQQSRGTVTDDTILCNDIYVLLATKSGHGHR